MSVSNGFTIEVYGFMHSLRTFWHMPLRKPSRNGMEIEVEDSEDRRQRQNKSRCSYGRQLTAQQNDERRQDNGDRKRLACHHPSDLLCSLTRERIGGGQHGVVSPALRASPFRTFHVLCVRHLMRMRIPSIHALEHYIWCKVCYYGLIAAEHLTRCSPRKHTVL